MKLYDFPGAPNPRRVTIFAAEKGIELATELVDMRARAHKTDDFLRKHPSGKLPVLELDDGTCIGESIAICRYLEALFPEPNLLGSDALEIGLIDMHQRIIELELMSQIGTSWVNGPIVAKMGLVKPIEAAKDRSDQLTHSFYKRLDAELAQREFVAGARFTLVDITAVVAIDFASAMVGLRPKEELSNLWRWHAQMVARPAFAT